MGRQQKLPDGMWQRGKTYYARFNAGGREIRKKLSVNLVAAKAMLNDLRARADKSDFGLLDNAYPWRELKAEFLRWVRQTLRRSEEYARDLANFEAYREPNNIRDITHAYIVGYREWRFAKGSMLTPKAKPKRRRRGEPEAPPTTGPVRKEITPRTINKEVATLRNMLNKGVAWGRIGSNPIEAIKPLRHDAITKQRRSLSLAEVEAVFQASPDHLRPVFRAFLTTGMRLRELVNMKFEDIDFERRTVTVRAEIAKNHKAREIPLDDATLATVRELQATAADRRPMPGTTRRHTELQAKAFSREHVFVTKVNTPWRNNLLLKFRAVCRKAGIKDAERGGAVDLHSLRVSFTTLALDGGANPKAVQAILGHSTLALTMGVYAKATERAKRDAVAALPFATSSNPSHLISLHEAHNGRTKVADAAQPVIAKVAT